MLLGKCKLKQQAIHIQLLEWLKFKRVTISSISDGIEELKLSYTACGL